MSVYRTLIHQLFHRKVRNYRCLLERQYHEHLRQLRCVPVVRPMARYNANVNLALKSYRSEGNVMRIVKKIIVYEVCSFTAVFTRAHYWFIFWTRSSHSANSLHISFGSIFNIVFSYTPLSTLHDSQLTFRKYFLTFPHLPCTPITPSFI